MNSHRHYRNHRICELYLRRQLRKARRRGQQEVVDSLTFILKNELALCALCCALEDQEDQEETNLIGAPGFPFLQFLFANWPAILEMIRALVDLFQVADAGEPE